MKKFLYVALVALTMGFMTSCQSGGSTSYTKGGPMPSINFEAGTVNGKTYDTKTDKCWKVDISASSKEQSASETKYYWGSEFELVAEMEELMWTVAQTGQGNASYSYSATSDADYETCMKHNLK